MSDMPLVVAPESLGARADPRLEPLVEWLAAHRPWFDAQLASHGAIALRGFEIGTMADFQRVVAAFGQPVGRYLGGVSSRTDLGGDVQTSTNYPGHEPVRLHNEFAHAPRRPERILLFALAPSEVDGETTVADGRRIAAALDPELRARFAASGLGYFWTYLARPDSGLARLFKSWQEAFATDDPQEAEAVCRSLGFTSGWTSSGLLWTHSHGPALVSDPIDGAPIWFGQYLARSAGTLAEHAAVTAALAAGPGRGGLMRYVSLGTERATTPAEYAHIQAVSSACEVAWRWQRGDVLVVDNLRCQHGRRPYRGARSILVSLTGATP